MRTSNATGLVILGVFATAFGGLAYWRESRRGNRVQALWFVVGIAGIYLIACALIEHVGWLYIPGLTLLAATYVGQFLAWRRARRAAAEYTSDTDKP